jgi:Nucleotidyl transferase AbiEii toxin, Type IV TA system
MPPNVYETPGAFRQALESRINARVNTNAELQRLRRLVAFDRLLARLFMDQSCPWIVKGGYSFEVRYGMSARTTKDIDLSLPEMSLETAPAKGAIQKLWDDLQEAAARDLGDHFVIRIGAPQQEFDAPPGGGARFPVEVLLDRRTFAKFHLDVGIGDIVLGSPEWTKGEEFLAFAGISPAQFRILPIAQQFAEKVHSYTVPRKSGINSRVKDLIDLVLILDKDAPAPESVKPAIEATFNHRGTHEIPVTIPTAPPTWTSSFTAMAKQVNISETTVEGAVARVNEYWKGIF